MRRWTILGLLAIAAVWAAHAETPAAEKPDPLAPIAFLVGSWHGEAAGDAGGGTLERAYERVLNAHFVRERNVTTYPPQEQNPKGEVHEHQAYFSYDHARGRIMLRQFHQEGFVNTYAFDPAASTGSKLVFASEDFENFDDAWKGRETYDVISPDEFIETFELAEPGKPFEIYSRSHLRRAGALSQP